MRSEITPTPTDEEAAAITAAVMMMLSSAAPAPEPQPVSPRWRFSGRWWNHSHVVQRRRPSVR